MLPLFKTNAMPFGSYSCLADIIHLVSLNNPGSVLDLGIGNGMNGAAVRNYCGKHVRLVGVEAWGNYNNPLWDLYNKVHINTIEEYLNKSDEFFEVILMTDVLEHFDMITGLWVIEKLKKRLTPKGCLLISTPAVWIEQGAAHGNKWEQHKSLWHEMDFQKIGMTIVRNGSECKYGHRMIIAEYLNR